jgi:uncharacterized cupredoxin-like copper-binding protein
MRLRLHVLALVGVLLVAALPADAQGVTSASGQSPAALQNQLIARSDGTLYLVRDGTRHLVTPASLSDDDVAAIPEGTAYSNGLVPADAIAALLGPTAPVGGSALLAPLIPAPAPASASAAPSAAPTAAPSSAAPTAAPSSAASSVHVTLDEWSVTPDSTTLAAGKVTFAVSDAGKGEHEMVLFKSDKEPGSLPVTRGKVDEAAIGQKIGEVEGLRAGDNKSASFDLKPGSYILICNLTNHYSKGMVSQVEVK